MQLRQLAAIVIPSLLLSVHLQAQANLRASDPRIKTDLVTAGQTRKVGEPIVVDVYLQNLEQADIRKDKFSPISSSVGSPQAASST